MCLMLCDKCIWCKFYFFTSLTNIEKWIFIHINKYEDYVLKKNNNNEKILVELKVARIKTSSISDVTNNQIIITIEK